MSSKSGKSGKSGGKKGDKKSNSKSGNKKSKEETPKEPKIPWVQKVQDLRLSAVDYDELKVNTFRCSFCRLTYYDIDKFLAHACWRKYFIIKLHLNGARTFRCVKCACLFQSMGDYSCHKCVMYADCTDKGKEVEQVGILNKWNHLDFYINWRMRLEDEAYYVPKLIAICSKCGDKFYSKLHFLLHSCAQKPPHDVFFICDTCKIVYWTYDERQQHFLHAPPAVADCSDNYEVSLEIRFPCLLNTIRSEFDKNLQKGSQWPLTRPERILKLLSRLKGECEEVNEIEKCEEGFEIVDYPDCYRCFKCFNQYCNLEEFLLHTCVAGHLLDPLCLHLMLYCTKCSCLFAKPEWLIAHFEHCMPEKFVFIRCTERDELLIFLRRWQKELWRTRHLPERMNLYRCDYCYLQMRDFETFLVHIRDKHNHLILPLQLLETYTCEACNYVAFEAVDMRKHRKKCSVCCEPNMVKTHYKMSEVQVALKLWTKLPRRLLMDMNKLQLKHRAILWV